MNKTEHEKMTKISHKLNDIFNKLSAIEQKVAYGQARSLLLQEISRIDEVSDDISLLLLCYDKK